MLNYIDIRSIIFEHWSKLLSDLVRIEVFTKLQVYLLLRVLKYILRLLVIKTHPNQYTIAGLLVIAVNVC